MPSASFLIYMPMRKLFSALTILLWVSAAYAQQFKRVYLFDDFVQAKIVFKNHSTTNVALNYDASNKTMLFKQGEDIMEITNTVTVDTIFVAGHKFVPAAKGFHEVVRVSNGEVLIDWLLKDVNIGSKGALGSVTQGSVHNLQMSDFGNYDAMYYTPYGQQKIGATDVYRRSNDNTYYIMAAGKLSKVKSEKHLQKLFPSHKEEISSFAKEHKTNMKEASSALAIIDFCLGLK